ncbi:MAG: DUF5667 domain-containing protein [Jatrophihabitantaceae bacterium]
MAEHRVSMLGASLRRYEDPARSADPRIRALVTQLATLDPGPLPRAHFRAELRAQLVSVAPRLVAEGPAIELPRASGTIATPLRPAARPGTKVRGAAARTTRISFARPLAVVSAVVVVFALLLGGAVLLSKRALPGDALYALKRANENVALSLANGGVEKGRMYLSLAETRADEVSALLSRSSAMDAAGSSAAAGVNSRTAALIATTLDSADSDVRNGAQLLGDEAVRTGSPDPLSIITGWAPDQLARLRSIVARLDDGALRDRVVASAQLTSAAFSRAEALRAVLGCRCPNKMVTDGLGPVPCPGCSAVRDPALQSSAPPAPRPAPPATASRPATLPKAPAKATSVTTAAAPIDSTPPPAPAPVTGTTVIKLPKLSVQLPSLPLPLPLPLPTSPAPTTASASTASPSCTLSMLGICLDP